MSQATTEAQLSLFGPSWINYREQRPKKGQPIIYYQLNKDTGEIRGPEHTLYSPEFFHWGRIEKRQSPPLVWMPMPECSMDQVLYEKAMYEQKGTA